MRALFVPPIRCIVHASVFDAFGWAKSTTLGWCPEHRADASNMAAGEPTLPTSSNPPGLGFVIRGPRGAFPFLPRESCSLHLPRVELPRDADMLAPWAIDDATDLLYENRTAPNDALFLATTSLAAVYWGLHDWAHFHSHGPFEEVAATELQCDVSALVWLRLNRGALGLGDDLWDTVRRCAVELSTERAATEGVALDMSWLEADELVTLAEAAATARPDE